MTIDEKVLTDKVRAELFNETGDASALIIDDALMKRAIDEAMDEMRRQAIAEVKAQVRERFGAMLKLPVAQAIQAASGQLAEQVKAIGDETMQVASETMASITTEAAEAAAKLRVPRPLIGRYLLTVEPKNVVSDDIIEELRGIIGGDKDWLVSYLRNFDVRVPYRTHAVLVGVGELSLKYDRKSYGDIVAAAAAYGLVPCPIGIIPEISAATDGIKFLRIALNIAPRDYGPVYTLGRGNANSWSGNVEWCTVTTAHSESLPDDRIMAFAILE